jgi:F-type H+-transporting ATPase subunit b
MLQIDATFIVVFLIVWTLVVVLSRTFWKPIIKVMRDREAGILDDGAAHRKNMEAYEQNLQEVERTLKSARMAAEKIREELEVEAMREKSALLADVNAVSKQEMDRGKSGLRQEISRAKMELASEAGRLAEQIERRLLH